jgi:TPR repeat protein
LGVVFDKDLKEAKRWYKKAAQQRHARGHATDVCHCFTCERREAQYQSQLRRCCSSDLIGIQGDYEDEDKDEGEDEDKHEDAGSGSAGYSAGTDKGATIQANANSICEL